MTTPVAQSNDAPALLALDWGTSSVRAYLVSAKGIILDSRAEPQGIMHVPNKNFSEAFLNLTQSWRIQHPNLPALMSGMIGSTQGWQEAPYCASSASARELAAKIVRVQTSIDIPVYIAPGIILPGSRPDVMRGEETQIIGALAQTPDLIPESLFVLPGTHSKWVNVESGHITNFETYMTGELFAALSQHTILGRQTSQNNRESSQNTEAFARGVTAMRDARVNGFSAMLFSTRSLVLSGSLASADALHYLSGLLIGDEIRSATSQSPKIVTLIGDAHLCERYIQAFAIFGLPAPNFIDNPCAIGLWTIARMAKLI